MATIAMFCSTVPQVYSPAGVADPSLLVSAVTSLESPAAMTPETCPWAKEVAADVAALMRVSRSVERMAGTMMIATSMRIASETMTSTKVMPPCDLCACPHPPGAAPAVPLVILIRSPKSVVVLALLGVPAGPSSPPALDRLCPSGPEVMRRRPSGEECLLHDGDAGWARRSSPTCGRRGRAAISSTARPTYLGTLAQRLRIP